MHGGEGQPGSECECMGGGGGGGQPGSECECMGGGDNRAVNVSAWGGGGGGGNRAANVSAWGGRDCEGTSLLHVVHLTVRREERREGRWLCAPGVLSSFTVCSRSF